MAFDRVSKHTVGANLDAQPELELPSDYQFDTLVDRDIAHPPNRKATAAYCCEGARLRNLTSRMEQATVIDNRELVHRRWSLIMPKADMNFVEQTLDYIDTLEDNTLNDRSITCNFGKLAAECGYEYFTVTRLPQPKIRLGPAMLLSRWSKAWLSYYDGAGYYQYDPVGQRCLETTEPFIWADVRYPANDRMASRVMSEAAEHGMRHGLCVPMHGLSGFPAVASFAGAAPELSRKRRNALHLASIATYGWFERHENHRREATHMKLSPRERDVLIWTALGKTNGQVGVQLGVSSLTVRSHLERARLKLGAVNAVSAVVEALRHREIRL